MKKESGGRKETDACSEKLAFQESPRQLLVKGIWWEARYLAGIVNLKPALKFGVLEQLG